VTLYKVHQRVAKTFQRGRAFLAGDAAHINNPLGGRAFLLPKSA
jgi:3-(3-hydroxy-phenyl)propionate hydroxylase